METHTNAPNKTLGDLMPGQKFNVSHAKDAQFKAGGLRNYFVYRDLGIAESTHGGVVAHVVKANEACPPGGTGYHTHQCDFQLVYCLSGRATVDFEGQGKVELSAGDCWLQPPDIRHSVLDYSEDFEVLEIVMPANFGTKD